MSRVSSSTNRELPTNGPMPLTRCPKCPRLDPLVRCTTQRRENGNFGRESVKCESKVQPGKAIKQCHFFMWFDEYIAALGICRDDMMIGAAPEEAVESRPYVATDALAAELKNMNSELKNMNAKLKNMNANLGKLKNLNANLAELKNMKKLFKLFYISLISISVLFLMMNRGSKY